MTDESTVRPERTTTNDDTTDIKERERALDILVRNYPGMVYHCRDDEDWSMLYVNDGAIGLTRDTETTISSRSGFPTHR